MVASLASQAQAAVIETRIDMSPDSAEINYGVFAGVWEYGTNYSIGLPEEIRDPGRLSLESIGVIVAVSGPCYAGDLCDLSVQ